MCAGPIRRGVLDGVGAGPLSGMSAMDGFLEFKHVAMGPPAHFAGTNPPPSQQATFAASSRACSDWEDRTAISAALRVAL